LGSTFNLPLPPPPIPSHSVLSKADLEASQIAYRDLLSTAKAYRTTLATLSTSASAFGSALEACARLKEARSEGLEPPGGSLSNSFTAKGSCTANSLLTASGVHQLIANHQQILSEVVYRSFEVPLLHEVDIWRRKLEEEEASFQSESKALSKEIRKMEKEGMKVYQKRKRDVGSFREHLVKLTRKLDGLTTLQANYKRDLLRDSQEMSKGIVEASASLVRAEVDIYEALARKGWSGGGLEDLLEKGSDLFSYDAAGHNEDDGQIFSILPQKSILIDSAHANDGTATAIGGAGSFISGRPAHMRSDSSMVEGDRYQSLAGAVSGLDADSASMFSEGGTGMGGSAVLNRPRGVRPFSPPPAERVRDPGPLAVSSHIQGQDSAQMNETSIHAMLDECSSAERFMSPSTIQDSSGKTVVDGHAPTIQRGRERRWSITDDGVVSE
jgi:Skp family chaperone for outer membrane proteins